MSAEPFARARCGELTLRRACREFFREPEAVFWMFVFPMLLALALGLAFRKQARRVDASASSAVERPQRRSARCATRPPRRSCRGDADSARAALRQRARSRWWSRRGLRRTLEYRFDPTRPEARLARSRCDDALQRAAGRGDPSTSREREVDASRARATSTSWFPGCSA